MITKRTASAGHRLGQIIGDWYEQYFVLPLLSAVADDLNLFLDSRFRERPCRRSRKIIWADVDGNQVDYDFVLELNGAQEKLGAPVAFVESFWRRGARHSKDKSRDDSGKLIPMRDTYPTARFLGVVASGDFTEPAREVFRSRGIDVFYVPKQKVVTAFGEWGLTIDYPDSAAESEKKAFADMLEAAFAPEVKMAVAQSLRNSIGQLALEAYSTRVRACLSALPQEIRLSLRHESAPHIFRTVTEVSDFLSQPLFKMDTWRESYNYEISFSDGSEFARNLSSVAHLEILNQQVEALYQHMLSISQRAAP